MLKFPSFRTWYLIMALSCWAFVIVLVYLADIGQVGHYFGAFYQYPGGDKIGHFLMMGLLSLCSNLALGGRQVRLMGRLWLLGSLLVWGVVFLEECSQYWFALRTCSLLDLLADTLGIWLGGRLALKMRR